MSSMGMHKLEQTYAIVEYRNCVRAFMSSMGMHKLEQTYAIVEYRTCVGATIVHT